MTYTTNALASLRRSLRKIIKTRGSFPTDQAAIMLLYLAIQNAGVRWRKRRRFPRHPHLRRKASVVRNDMSPMSRAAQSSLAASAVDYNAAERLRAKPHSAES